MSLANIMREQADEKLARLYQTEEANEYYDCDLELVKQLSLQESEEKINPNLVEMYTEEYAKRLEEDELLAFYLQKEERGRVRSDIQTKDLKTLAPLEYKILTAQFGLQPESDSVNEDAEYNYIEPYQLGPQNITKIEYPLLYDNAQKKEDKEIGHVSKRMLEKRVNAAPVAMHHKQYATRNKGKVLMYGSNRPKVTPKSYSIPIRDELHDYGLITKVLGGSRFTVFCYSHCSTKLCRMTGKLKYTKRYIRKGDIILYKIRTYQDKKADIVHMYTTDEYDQLLELGELVEHDPMKELPEEIFKKILAYLDTESRHNLAEIYRNRLI
jgi:translation initiation factor 1A